jgi:hypothetical protein
MPDDNEIVDRIKAIIAQPGQVAGNAELSDLLESAIHSEDKDVSSFAAKVCMLIGTSVVPAFASCESDRSLGDVAIDAIHEIEIDDSADEILTSLGLEVDDATDLIKSAIRLREEARRKSGFYK